jgi:predicted acetyltransferase
MLTSVLDQARELGLASVLLAVEGENPGSQRTILKHGGYLERQFANAEGATVSVYLIPVK